MIEFKVRVCQYFMMHKLRRQVICYSNSKGACLHSALLSDRLK